LFRILPTGSIVNEFYEFKVRFVRTRISLEEEEQRLEFESELKWDDVSIGICVWGASVCHLNYYS
jgi:hypothetical protein